MAVLKFSVDSALLNEIGEKLVESVHVALVELVKNAYDADATQVTVKIISEDSGGSEVHIIDNGSGMTKSDLDKYWMRIATTHKVAQNTSPKYGRSRTGSKGIGRFCCRRLGHELSLTTIAKKSKNLFEKTVAVFDWSKFEAGTDVSDIECNGEVTSFKGKNTGTILKIKSNKDEWKNYKYNFLKRHLAVLAANRGVDRKGFQEDPGFNIRLIASDFDETVCDLRDNFLNAGWGTLKGTVDKNGVAKYHLDAYKIGKKSITFNKKVPNLKGITFKIGIIPDRKEYWKDKTLFSKQRLQEILPSWGGVQIRYNGFRVYPYGDDDWLNIDHDRGLRKGTLKNNRLVKFAHKLEGVNSGRALLSLLSMRSHIGSVDIGPEAIGFELKSSREGFLRSDSLDELNEFVRFGIDWATVYRDYHLRAFTEERLFIASERLEAIIDRPIESDNIVEEAVKYLKNETQSIVEHLPQKQKRQISERINQATDIIIDRNRLNRNQLDHLRLIASTTTLVLIFAHDVKSFIGIIPGIVNQLRNIKTKLEGDDARLISNLVTSLSEVSDRFHDLLGMTSLIGVESKNCSKVKLAIKRIIRKSVACFAGILSTYNVNVDFDEIPNNLKVGPMLEAEMYAIILNVLSNSIKAVIAGGKNRKIKFTGYKENKETVLKIFDTGVGLNKKYFDEVFIPFIHDPGGNMYKGLNVHLNHEDEYILGSGTGLGLSIIKEIVISKKGSIQFIKPGNKWSSTLEIRLP